MIDGSRSTRIGLIVLLAAVSPASAQRAPAPEPTGLAPAVLALACAPTLAVEAPETPLRVTGGQDGFIRLSFHPGDLITINAGTMNGVAVGDEFYVRRAQIRGRDRVSQLAPATIRTTGWIRVYAADETMSLATITHACDSIQIDDYLEPFTVPVVPTPGSRGEPERDDYGRVVIGTDRRSSFGRGDFMIVNRGSNHGVAAGTHFVVYRDKGQDENFLFELGEAMAVDVKPESATVWVTLSRDAMQIGDYVAIRR